MLLCADSMLTTAEDPLDSVGKRHTKKEMSFKKMRNRRLMKEVESSHSNKSGLFYNEHMITKSLQGDGGHVLVLQKPTCTLLSILSFDCLYENLTVT